jgi:GT2 family glycosyltransferase
MHPHASPPPSLDAPVFYDVIVSIVTYHSDLALVRSALTSLKGQSQNMQVVVVDNDSSPDYQAALREVVQDACASVECVLLRAPRNGGFGYGHNLAMLSAPASRMMLVMNPDAALQENCLSHLMAFMEAHPQAGLVTPKVFYPDGRLQPLNKRWPTVLDLGLRLFLPPAAARIPFIAKRLQHYSMMDMGYDTPYRLPFASGCCMLFRRDILMRLGGFDEGFFLYFEDADISQRVNEIAQTWFCPDATITHAWQRGSRKSFTLLWIMLQSAARYFAKWGLRLW